VATAEATAVSDPEHPGDALADNSWADFQELPHIPRLSESPLGVVQWIFQACVGLIVLVALLAIAASIPLVNLLALGYLMEIQARVAQTGKIRSAFFLVPAARRLGGMLLAVWLWLLPIHFLAEATRDCWLLAPGGTAAWLWASALVVASVLIAVHLLLAIACGGGWWRFVRPISNVRRLRAGLRDGGYWRDANHWIGQFVAAFQGMQLLRLGLLGFAAAYLWLALPTLLFTMLDDVTNRMQIVGFLLGCLALTVTLPWIPLLLVHVAVADRWRAIFEWRAASRLALQSPFCWMVTTVILMACSTLPLLYTALLKNQIPPHATRWDLMLVFLVTVVPARVLIGWTYHRATRKVRSDWSWLWRGWQLINVGVMLVASGFYVYFLNLAANDGELGRNTVWQLHTVLLPWPF
jgi:hypothetical protein